MFPNTIRQPRRNVIVVAGIGVATALLAACTTYGKKPAAESSSAPAGSAPAGTGGAQTPAGVLTKTADVPVGSGVILGDIVVTQPTAGVFEGFSSVCTHAGCTLAEVSDGLISCPCHGSKFKLDGSVANGPAKSPLEAKPIKVEGDSILAG